MEEDIVDEVGENEIRAAHFEESMKYAHRSSSGASLHKHFSSVVVLALNSSLKVIFHQVNTISSAWVHSTEIRGRSK
ncbi:hypothetical protein AAHA92_14768 [Salvia divinorum]|uniref:Uncharacterized protein n=1 Tax=Salvia divinorum TaxID=28513 RepID=A0ABD1HCL4_SALDI